MIKPNKMTDMKNKTMMEKAKSPMTNKSKIEIKPTQIMTKPMTKDNKDKNNTKSVVNSAKKPTPKEMIKQKSEHKNDENTNIQNLTHLN